MNRLKFIVIIFFVNIFFIFLKISQHNLLIKLNYEKQRYENKKYELKKIRNQVLIKYLTMTSKDEVQKIAIEKFGMQPVKLSSVITVTEKIF